jgi:hypothetical protein
MISQLLHVRMVLNTMRQNIECGNASYDVSPPAGSPCIAAFWIYDISIGCPSLSLSSKNIIKAKDEEA